MSKRALKPKHWAEPVAGICIGVQILSKGFDKLDHFSHHPFSVGFLFFAGGFVILGSLLHVRLERRIKNLHGLFHLAEGLAMIVSALVLLDGGKVRLPAFIAFAGCLYVVLGIVGLATRGAYTKHRALLMRGIGSALLAFGAAAFVWVWRTDRDPMVLGVSGLMAALGLFYTLFSGWIVRRFPKGGEVPEPPEAPAPEAGEPGPGEGPVEAAPDNDAGGGPPSLLL